MKEPRTTRVEAETDQGNMSAAVSSDFRHLVAIGNLDKNSFYLQGPSRLTKTAARKFAIGILMIVEDMEDDE